MSTADHDDYLSEQKVQEAAEFDAQTTERIAHGLVPDLRRLEHVDWFYNNVWRDPKMARLHWHPRIDKIIAAAREAGGHVLELGCGCGMLSLELARAGLRVTGVDLSPVSIEVAKQYRDSNPFQDGFGQLDYICGDFDELEFAAESIDSVVFFRSLHHFPDTPRVVAKCARLLKPGGNLLVSEPVRSHFNQDSALMATLLRLVLPTWQPYAEKISGPWTQERIDDNIATIYQEYTYEGEHHQSAMDNSTDSAEAIRDAVSRSLEIVSEELGDAFTDKILGGLRGPDRYELAGLLKAFDAYLVQSGILPPTSIEIHAKKHGSV